MNKQDFENKFWRNYLFIEVEMLEVSKYITFDEKNFDTYSSMLQKIILETGSEIENVFRELTQLSGNHLRINDYINPVLSEYPELTSQKVSVNNSYIELIPFDGWNLAQPSQSLVFWEKYNKIKHNRILNEEEANLENALKCTSALFILEMYYMKTLYDNDDDCAESYPEDESRLFKMDAFPHHARETVIDRLVEAAAVLD